MSDLPSLGRSGVQTVRRITGIDNPGYQKVDPDADIIAGMVAARTTDSNGNVILTPCNATTVPVAIFALHKTLNFYISVVDEAAVVAATINLAHANVKNVGIVTSTGTQYVEKTNYTVNTTNGIVTNVNMTNASNVKISYLYKDTSTSGLDQTLPTGLITIFEGAGEIGTFIYDTTYAIAVNDLLRCNADGFLSTHSALTGKVCGIVVSPPSASNTEMIFRLNIEY